MILGLMPGFITSTVLAQIPGDQLGVHDLSPAGTSPVKGSTSAACLYCHATHSALPGPPLWNQTLSVQAYTSYTSSTYHQAAIQPVVGNTSKLCLSCHDGTVAPGQTVAAGKMNMGGSMAATAKFGADLRSSHPFSMKTPLVDSPELASQLFSGSSTTRDPAVKMVKGNVECVTCHDAHFQAKDHTIGMFLVRDNLGGQLCLACHDPNRVVGGQATNGQTNYLANWPVSIHATATNHTTNQPYVGGYNSVAENACNQCHMSHNAAGPARLLRGADEQACLACHNGGSGVSPAAPNVFAEFAKGGHPFPLGNNVHDRVESGVLNNNRHATCVDCHNPHQSMQAAALGAPPVIRPSQNGVVGVSAADGITVLNPAINQFENCLRCHGTSAGKLTDPARFGYLPSRVVSAADPLNLISEFSPSSTSSHPVTHDRRSALMQPSLRSQMLNLDGTNSTRTIGTRILCTDCHNSDDNREFGGIGPNGPHGSRFSHILERRYEFSQAASPGGLLSNLYPSPDLSINGPYAMCSKCHDLTQILANTSFSEHARHISDGFSCSTCHVAHGMGAQNGSVSGERLVNFDVNVVGPNGAAPIAYNRATNSCTLACHGHAHTAIAALGASPAGRLKRSAP
jgi:predicted CXXCH cytochrome family protein